MTDRKQQLRQELLAAGASEGELKELLPIASQLGQLKSISAGSIKKYDKTNRWWQVVKPAVFVASGLAFGIFIILFSQAALPTSWLYPVQKFSDNLAISLHPQFRANVMMKRAQQVNQLVANHASTKQVLATLADYTTEASVYKSTPHANYAAFEYCSTNLQQAATSTNSPSVRQAISSSLQSLKDT